MASDLSKYMGNILCRWLAGQAMPTAPLGLYVGLYNGDPKTSGVEVTTLVNASAGRLAVPFTAPANDGVTNTMASTADADFGLSESDTTITHVAVFDDPSESAGNRLASHAVGSNPVVTGQSVKISAANLVFLLGS